MTIDERVEWCLDQKGGRPLFGDEARVIIKQAITAHSEQERAACASACEETPIDIGCSALEAEGVVRRTRDALASAIRARSAEEEAKTKRENTNDKSIE